MEIDKGILNLLRVGLDTDLAHKAAKAGYTLTKLKQARKSDLIKHFEGDELEHILNVVKRKPISEDVLLRLIEECDWKCCVCRNINEEQPVIIHHIVEHSKTQNNTYENLVILCLKHHALAHSEWKISRHPLPPDLVRVRKKEWIEAVKKYKEETRPGVDVNKPLGELNWAPRIHTGKTLVNALRDVMFYDFDSEGITSENEAELAGNFLNYLQDLGDLLPISDPGNIVKTEFQLNSYIKELEENSLLVFGERQLREFNFDGAVATYPVATIRVVRSVMTPEREEAAAEWDEIVSKLDQVESEEREQLFERLAELLSQYGLTG